MGITQGRTLLSSLNLSFVAKSHGQYRDLGYVSRRYVPSAEEGTVCGAVLAADRLNLSPTYPIKIMPLTPRKFLSMACSSPALMYHPCLRRYSQSCARCRVKPSLALVLASKAANPLKSTWFSSADAIAAAGFTPPPSKPSAATLNSLCFYFPDSL